MADVNFQQATFLLGAALLSQLPADEGIEVAFAGRSNAGKSSALNVLTRQKSLARTSKTPGRTQQINVFGLDDTRRLIDLPGYGFAKVSIKMKTAWQKTLNAYLHQRQCLQGLVVLMDARHPLKDLDKALIDWCLECQLPCHLVLTKSDKLKQKEKATAKNAVLKTYGDTVSYQFFSAHNQSGLDQLEAIVSGWLNSN